MWDCGLTEFPQVLCKQKSLKTLDIGWNKKIQNLPHTLESLTKLGNTEYALLWSQRISPSIVQTQIIEKIRHWKE